jgi:hypothetical protein
MKRPFGGRAGWCNKLRLLRSLFANSGDATSKPEGCASLKMGSAAAELGKVRLRAHPVGAFRRQCENARMEESTTRQSQ